MSTCCRRTMMERICCFSCSSEQKFGVKVVCAWCNHSRQKLSNAAGILTMVFTTCVARDNRQAKLTPMIVTTTGPIKYSVCVSISQLAQLTKPVEGKTQHRMQVLGIYDLDHDESYCALRRMRKAVTHSIEESDEKLHDIVRMTGGRLAFLSNVSRAPDMEESSKVIVRHEKAWLRSQLGLIPDHDDDVMDEVGGLDGCCAILLAHSCVFHSKNGRHVPGYCCRRLSRCNRGQKRNVMQQ